MNHENLPIFRLAQHLSVFLEKALLSHPKDKRSQVSSVIDVILSREGIFLLYSASAAT